MKSISRSLSRTALLALGAGLLAAMARAACLDAAPAVAERSFMHAKQSYRAELCLLRGSHKQVADIGHGLMQLNLFRVSDQAGQPEGLAAQIIEPVDVEGQLRELSLDRATYALHAEIPTVAVLIKSRDRGVEHDQYLSDLQLYMPQAAIPARGQTQALQRVASINTSRESWGTQCGKDCQDTIHSKTLVIVGSKGLLTQRQGVAKARLCGPSEARRAARTHVRANVATTRGPHRQAFPKGCGQKGRRPRCQSSPGDQPGCGLRLACDLSGQQRGPLALC